MIVNIQHQKERALDNSRRIRDEIGRFDAIKILALSANFIIESIANARSVTPRAHTGPRLLELLETSRLAIASLPPFDLPHELLIINCATISRAMLDLRLALQEAATRTQLVDRELGEIQDLLQHAMELTAGTAKMCTEQVLKRRTDLA